MSAYRKLDYDRMERVSLHPDHIESPVVLTRWEKVMARLRNWYWNHIRSPF